tara:strand:+ start:58 stop:558 length:501 start_codon:yes stop_codon:yes gene_type:complete
MGILSNPQFTRTSSAFNFAVTNGIVTAQCLVDAPTVPSNNKTWNPKYKNIQYPLIPEDISQEVINTRRCQERLEIVDLKDEYHASQFAETHDDDEDPEYDDDEDRMDEEEYLRRLQEIRDRYWEMIHMTGLENGYLCYRKMPTRSILPYVEANGYTVADGGRLEKK